MDMQLVNSSNIRAVGYDALTNIMRVEFNSGSVYDYHQVPEEIYRQLLISPSFGKFFAVHVKNRFGFNIIKK